MSNRKYRNENLDHEKLLASLDYDCLTGIFMWKKNANKLKIGKIAGYPSNGYLVVRYNYTNYLAHRLAWFYVNKVWPKEFIDHIDRNKSNNRIANLRTCNNSQNCINKLPSRKNATGVKGVHYIARVNKYKAVAVLNRKNYYLGYHPDIETAKQAYENFANTNHGEFKFKPNDNNI